MISVGRVKRAKVGVRENDFASLYMGTWEFSPTDAAIYEVAKRHGMTVAGLTRIYADPRTKYDYERALEVEGVRLARLR